MTNTYINSIEYLLSSYFVPDTVPPHTRNTVVTGFTQLTKSERTDKKSLTDKQGTMAAKPAFLGN